MRRRFVQATVAAVTVAVILLGIPMAILSANMIRNSEIADVRTRCEALGRVVDRRLTLGDTIDSETLELYVRPANSPAVFVEVVLPDKTTLTAGDPIQGRTESVTLITSTGATIAFTTSWWAIFWKSFAMVMLVVAAAAVAFGAGIGMALILSRRLAAPLVLLAASAEQLGAGQTRPRLEPTGVEELDLVASELARSADRMAGRLAVERQFAADASHQLRTPLTALMMRLEEIQAASDSPEVQEEARISLEQVERLVTVVDDLLKRSRSASGGTTEPVRLMDIVRQQEEEWLPAFEAESREVDVQIPEDTEVLASPGALAQVLATLIENSLRHGDGTTTIRSRASGKNNVAIEVLDEGPGIADEIAGDIFERSVSTGQGTGLGLALARDLVAADGGRLELSSRVPPVFSVFLNVVPKQLDLDSILPQGRPAPMPRRRQRPPRRGQNL